MEGLPAVLASFVPSDKAYESIGGTDEFSNEVKEVIIPNPATGPAVMPEAMDFRFKLNPNPVFPARTFHKLINQPQILLGVFELSGQCQRNTVFFNETFTEEKFRKGNVTIGGGLLDIFKLKGPYMNVEGYSTQGEEVGYDVESCLSAAKNVDPAAIA